jgi:hypothetical protein
MPLWVVTWSAGSLELPLCSRMNNPTSCLKGQRKEMSTRRRRRKRFRTPARVIANGALLVLLPGPPHCRWSRWEPLGNSGSQQEYDPAVQTVGAERHDGRCTFKTGGNFRREVLAKRAASVRTTMLSATSKACSDARRPTNLSLCSQHASNGTAYFCNFSPIHRVRPSRCPSVYNDGSKNEQPKRIPPRLVSSILVALGEPDLRALGLLNVRRWNARRSMSGL